MSDFLKMTAPEGFTDVSFGGENYVVEDGVVTVPVSAAEFLYQFGFANAPEEPETLPEEPETPKKGRRAKKEA